MSPHLSYLRQCLTIVAILMLPSTALFAQVTIKEKVTINPKGRTGREINQLAPCSAGGSYSSFSGLIMNKKGKMVVLYDQAQRLGDYIPFLPPYATLVAHRFRADTVVRDDSIWARFYNVGSFQNMTCATINQVNYDQVGLPGVQPTYNLLPVQKGDSVQFLYVTDFYQENGVLDTLTLNSYDSLAWGWDLWFGSCDNCRQTWSEELKVTIAVVDTTLSFIPPLSTTVYPRYLGHNNNTDKNDTLDLQLQVQFNGTLVKNYWIRVDTTVLADSGGHSHGGNRPLGTFLLPRTAPQTGYDSVRTFARQTDSTGMVRFKYLASQFGGIERIRAERLSDTTSFDTLRLTTRVPALVPLQVVNYDTLVGGTSLHLGGSNHYGTQTLIGNVQSISFIFFTSYPNWHLRINDMSLVYGGGFDNGGNWGADIIDQYPSDPLRCNDIGHCDHRIGINADIDYDALNPQGVRTRLNPSQLKKLEFVISRVTSKHPFPEHNNHYHITSTQ